MLILFGEGNERFVFINSPARKGFNVDGTTDRSVGDEYRWPRVPSCGQSLAFVFVTCGVFAFSHISVETVGDDIVSVCPQF